LKNPSIDASCLESTSAQQDIILYFLKNKLDFVSACPYLQLTVRCRPREKFVRNNSLLYR